jgi:TonB family protein
LIEFIIDHRGFARLHRVLSATHPELGHAAVHAVNTWRFESPMKDGKAGDAMVRIPVRFTMADPVETP